MVKDMIEGELRKLISTEYRHMRAPLALCAKITRVTDNTSFKTYSLKILGNNNAVDARYPEIPQIRSEIDLTVDDVVAIVLLYGQLRPFILGKVL